VVTELSTSMKASRVRFIPSRSQPTASPPIRSRSHAGGSSWTI